VRIFLGPRPLLTLAYLLGRLEGMREEALRRDLRLAGALFELRPKSIGNCSGGAGDGEPLA
jgi:hypothetical protein